MTTNDIYSTKRPSLALYPWASHGPTINHWSVKYVLGCLKISSRDLGVGGFLESGNLFIVPQDQATGKKGSRQIERERQILSYL